MQWKAITSFGPCYALMFDNMLLYRRLDQIYDFFSPICRNSLCISGLGISRHTGFSLEYPSSRWIAGHTRYKIQKSLFKVDFRIYNRKTLAIWLFCRQTSNVKYCTGTHNINKHHS